MTRSGPWSPAAPPSKTGSVSGYSYHFQLPAREVEHSGMASRAATTFRSLGGRLPWPNWRGYLRSPAPAGWKCQPESEYICDVDETSLLRLSGSALFPLLDKASKAPCTASFVHAR